MMRAAVYQRRSVVTVEERPVPVAGDDEIVIEVSHCGICGTDLHFVIEGWGTPGTVHGHEYSGVVVEVGRAVNDWAIGDRVVGGPGRGCGGCKPCSRGAPHLCLRRGRVGIDPFQGAFARYKALRADAAYRIPDGLDLRTAALAEPVAVALRGVHRSLASPGDRVLVTGGGPIGLLTVAILRAFGVADVVLSEPSDGRRARAAALGATTIQPDELVEPDLPMDVVGEPFDAAIECSGRAEAMVAALANLTRGGTLVLSGTGIVRPQLDHLRTIMNELVVTGTYEYTPAEFEEAVVLLADERLPVDILIEPDDVPLAGLADAMRQLAAGALAGKVMVVPTL